jgi:hypothetical protein
VWRGLGLAVVDLCGGGGEDLVEVAYYAEVD